MKLFYIHGANATPGSFNFLSKQIGLPAEFANYDSGEGFYNNLDQIKAQVGTDDWFIVAHSLGGIYAAHLVPFLGPRLKGCVTLSTPYGGSEISDMLTLLHPFAQLFKDTGTRSRPMGDARKILASGHGVPWTAVVTSTMRVPYTAMENDGVVTVSSQSCLKDHMELVRVGCNHYEIVQDDTARDIILDRIKKLS